MALLVFGGCGGGSESSSNEERAEARSAGEETSETTEGTTGEAMESTQPYTAIVAPSAESQYAGESGSGPLDEVLVDGAQDLSDGPLKENRLVAYYGNPREGAMGVLGETDPETMMESLKEQTAASPRPTRGVPPCRR